MTTPLLSQPRVTWAATTTLAWSRGVSAKLQSSVDRFHFAAKPKRGGLSREDCFVLASDARRDQLVRSEFVDQLQRRVQHAAFQPPQLRSMTAPGY